MSNYEKIKQTLMAQDVESLKIMIELLNVMEKTSGFRYRVYEVKTGKTVSKHHHRDQAQIRCNRHLANDKDGFENPWEVERITVAKKRGRKMQVEIVRETLAGRTAGIEKRNF